MFRTFVAIVFATSAADVVADKAHRSGQLLRQRGAAVPLQASIGDSTALHMDSFVRILDFKRQLRVCNAYPLATPLDVYRGQAESLTGDSPMPYKTCRDFQPQLKIGDKLEFRLGGESGGTFSISDLPNNDATLLLVVHRHDTLSTAVAFESHVFADLDGAQVAVIDTYKGKAQTTLKIQDSLAFVAMDKKEGAKSASDGAGGQERRSEELRYGGVVAVSPGVYDVELDGQDGLAKAHSQLVALKHQCYVVIRTGIEAQQGASFPQELVVFPNPDPAQFRSAAAAGVRQPLAAAGGALLLAALATLAF
mmetsp:Transcript_22908/g.57859  ORF Transcript_22908/g.57859 Transcript_22908/m.57859 type:complete len:308 (-) Transcript_22908:97-1020(-)